MFELILDTLKLSFVSNNLMQITHEHSQTSKK